MPQDITIGITMGDPGGIGPEILLKSLDSFPPSIRFIIFASQKVLQKNSETLSLPLDGNKIDLVDIDNVSEPYFGLRPEVGGPASIQYLQTAFEYFSSGKIDGLVTGPIHKESWHAAGHNYPGQTEYCAEKTGTKEYCMLMAGIHFRVALLSTHYSLNRALQFVRKETIIKKLRLIHREFRTLGFSEPRIGCAALNPHAGEAGAFGDEEQKEIIPALEQLKTEGITIDGPIAPEVIFRVASESGRWDVILALYHDQAMIPLKLIDFYESANITLGLPLIRTSPDHGTAFDIAGKGIADPRSMIFAVHTAADWTRKRKVPAA